MRRDVYIQNDSGGFSVVAADAVDAIIEDGRENDLEFVTSHKAMLLELYGDDSMPVRIVVDEPLRADEEEQWLAKASWRIDAPDGRLIAMGGFDPDVMADWKEESGGESDGPGVAMIETAPGPLQVDIYAHVGSMNGRQILSEADERPGQAFRRSHPGRAFPVWLAHMLEFSSEEDPGHEDLWRDVPGSIGTGQLAIDADDAAPIGFLIHVTRANGSPGEPPADGWFGRDANSRVPRVFPLGVPTDVEDPDIESFRRRITGAPESAADVQPPPESIVEIIEVWTGDPLKALPAGAPDIELRPEEAYFLYWIAALTSESAPHFELWVTPKGQWNPPAPTEEYGVVRKSGSIAAIGPSPNANGWTLWWAARSAAKAIAGLADRFTIDLAMAPRNPETDAAAAIGRALYSGTVRGGVWQVSEASPMIGREALNEALSFVRDLVEKRQIRVRGDRERQALERPVRLFAREPGAVVWQDDVMQLADYDERTLLLLAAPVFRVRFAPHWRMDSD